MNYRWRLIILISNVLILYGVIYFIYIRPEHSEKKIGGSGKIKVSVYYEALCPDSKYFIVHHLSPVYEQLHQHITIDLIPYGKAQTLESEGLITFQCQHDEIECYANKIHACVIDLVHNSSIQLKYVVCMIENNENPDGIAEICGKKFDIDYSEILNCAKEEHGISLLQKHGERTNSLNPSVRFIPTVELNGSQTLVPQALILKDLQQALCSLFKVKPIKCDD